MGCVYEINDTLIISTSQGFPSDILDVEEHRKNPVTIDQVKDKIFSFSHKGKPRAFQLDPVRVFFFQWTDNGKWLAWGHALIQSLHIERKPGLPPTEPGDSVEFNADDWQTSGTYRIETIYDPEYQEIFTRNEAPQGRGYFDADEGTAGE